MSGSSHEAICARHADAKARPSPCARCGDFLCDQCFVRPPDMICARCVARTGSDRIAWERPAPSGWRRYLRTSADLLTAPTRAGTQIARGNQVALALLYWASLPALLGITRGAAVFMRTGSTLEALFQVPFLVATMGLQAVAMALVYYVLVAALGGRPAAGLSLRAALYQQATYLWMLVPMALLAADPPAGFLVFLLGAAVVVAVMRRGFLAVMLEAGGLSELRARIASAAVTAFAGVSFVVALVLVSLAEYR